MYPFLLMFLLELPYHLSPRIVLEPQQPIYVIGDSISAAMGARERVWPEALSDDTGWPVVNLAEPGATTRTARKQATRIDRQHALVIVEIGGNDLFGTTTPGEFREQLDALLRDLRRQRADVVMFELPLPPLYNRYGRVQRSLARSYQVPLIPKRYLTAVMARPSGTLDGLHLSSAGHRELARSVRGLIRTKAGHETTGR